MKSNPLVRKLVYGIATGLVCLGIASLLWFSGTLQRFEYQLWDLRQNLFAQPGEATDDIAVVLLDQNSLDWGKKENSLSWPWPREVYTYLINFIRRGNPRAIGFDVIFSEPSTYGVYDDNALGSAIRESSTYVGALFLGQQTGEATSWPEEFPTPQISIEGLDAFLQQQEKSSLSYPRASFPIPAVAKNAALLGNVNLKPDSDGIFRRARLFSLFDGKAVPSLGLGVYLAAARDKEGSTQSRFRIVENTLAIGNHQVPLDKNGDAILRYRGPSGTHTTYSAAAIIQSEIQALSGEEPAIDPAVFEDKYVLFGFSAPGLLDLRPTPVSAVYAGVEVHATMLDNFLSDDFIKPLPDLQVVLISLALTVLAGILVSIASGVAKNIILYVVFLPLPVLLGFLFFSGNTWFPVMIGETGLILTLAGGGLLNYATEGRQKRYIKNAFSQYLSPAVIEQLIANPERLKLGGERRTLSIFFSDLQGFTSISEGLSPEELTSLLNNYLSAMTDIIQEEEGTIDKYEGDAIIAFWNAPLDLDDHAVRCVRAALRCQQELARLRPVFRKQVGKELHMRIGINTGPAVVGNMGSHSRFDYTMFGDTVNLAARLEGVNKQFGTFTMISENTRVTIEESDGQQFGYRELARVAVVGRSEPVTVYEPMLTEEYRQKKQQVEAFHQALSMFYEGAFEEARQAFEKLAGQDPAAEAYAGKCGELQENPSESWKGVWVMTSK